jgi:hypothetical protein
VTGRMKHRVLKGTRRLKYDTVPRRRDGQVICMDISRNIDKPICFERRNDIKAGGGLSNIPLLGRQRLT